MRPVCQVALRTVNNQTELQMPHCTLTRGMCLSRHDLDPTKLTGGICLLSLYKLSHNKLEINDYVGDRDGGVAIPGISDYSKICSTETGSGYELGWSSFAWILPY